MAMRAGAESGVEVRTGLGRGVVHLRNSGLAGAGRGGVPSHLRAHPEPQRLTLLAALLHTREKEITDTLMDLLIATVHSIGARAEKRVTERGGCRLVPFLSSDGPLG